MADGDEGRSRAPLGALLGLIAVIVVVGLWLATPGLVERPESEAGAPAEPAVALSERAVIDPPATGVAVLESGQTLSIAAADVADGLTLDLRLGEPSTTADPLEGRILTEGRELPLTAAVSDDRNSVRIAVPPGWLSPERYVIEIKTTEKTHFPLRRYAVEVR